MRILLILKLATIGIVTNKIRSVLTTLGIVIGIAAVITMLTLGEGAQSEVTSQISSLGSNLVIIFPGTEFRGPPGTATDVEFSKRDYEYLANETRFPNITAVSPFLNNYVNVTRDSNEVFSNIVGTNEQQPKLENFSLDFGEFFGEGDVNSSKNVAVIGPDVAVELFPKLEPEDVIGQDIFIKNLRFKIVGVIESRGSGGFNESNKEIYVPYTTAGEKLFNTDKYNGIYLYVEDTELIDATIIKIEEKLGNFRGIEDKEDIDFSVFTSDDILDTASQITGIFTGLLSSIAAISLLVGGIGISNIMLVSVTERTKEIGLRKAIGAQRSDILLQFLLEAMLLTLLGGILGIVFGVLFGFLIGAATGIPVSLSINVVILATSVSAIVGIIFGFFPAYKAAGLDPIDALRYE